MKKRILQITLCLLAVLMMFTACKDTTTDPQGTTGTQGGTEAPAEDPKPEGWWTAETAGAVNLSEYAVVIAEDASSDVIKVATQLRNHLGVYCNVNIKSNTKDGLPRKGKEIIIGNTNRPESVAAYATMKEKNWSVSMVDGNILFAAGVEGSLPLALEWFKANCLQQGNNYAVVGNGSSYNYDYKTTEITLGTTPITDVVVAYLNGDQVGYVDAGWSMAYDIMDQFGQMPTVKGYKANADYTQILVASPSQAQKYLPAGLTVGTDQYIIKQEGKTVFVLADTAIAAEVATASLISYIKADTDGKVDLTGAFMTEAKTVDYATDKFALEEGSQYRVMSFNVLRTNQNSVVRFDYALDSILYYSPDVIGFQEYCAGYTTNLTPKLEQNGYTVIGNAAGADISDTTGATLDPDQNMTPIAFKTAKFDLVASGNKRMENTYDPEPEEGGVKKAYPGHMITWAVLKDKTTNKTFIVTTTHFFHLSDVAAADPVRVENAKELVTLVNELIATYNCPVISVGDYNNNENSETYKHLINKTANNDYPVASPLVNARYIATKEYSAGSAMHEQGLATQENTDDAAAIDHMLVTENIDVQRHRIAINQLTADASDHYPVFIDFSIPDAE